LNVEITNKIYKHEYEKLRLKIREEKTKEEQLQKITNMVRYYEGAVSGKPVYKFE
jgi:hypothetical protein